MRERTYKLDCYPPMATREHQTSPCLVCAMLRRHISLRGSIRLDDAENNIDVPMARPEGRIHFRVFRAAPAQPSTRLIQLVSVFFPARERAKHVARVGLLDRVVTCVRGERTPQRWVYGVCSCKRCSVTWAAANSRV